MKHNPMNQNLNSLPSVRFDSYQERLLLPQVSAVYFVVSQDSQVIYVGQTHNLRKRWKTHSKAKAIRGMGCRVFYLEVPAVDLDQVEQYYIWHLQPVLNGRRVSGLPDVGRVISFRDFLNRGVRFDSKIRVFTISKSIANRAIENWHQYLVCYGQAQGVETIELHDGHSLIYSVDCTVNIAFSNQPPKDIAFRQGYQSA